MGILNQKKNIRARIIQAKLQLTATAIAKQSDNVRLQLEQLPQFKAAKNILCYWSLPYEIITHEFILRNHIHKNIYLPKVKGRHLTIHKFIGASSMQAGNFGIMEPVSNVLTNLDLIDFAIVPGIAFTNNGHRLGRGGGYYDKVLPKLTNAYIVGVGFDLQLLKEIPCEAHDFILDKIVIAGK
ncbi:5-formyltetrahydrofolate cyclo-ligase [Saccharicrinis carchari]|uniref:5-formyltetrahydrofolate cyclo-ligase n=1 Tax=Saccharicrinis carchari TaxID=1168039 RepID=A0A521DCZ3_SACCC|nr:5-formyltetrahydrofolate cyclo-ligase [Saccharicrinis carchari]SMO68800.1 5-formyltetrahydrofolate cyclo-ligase [Saccharicrinis carchari]